MKYTLFLLLFLFVPSVEAGFLRGTASYYSYAGCLGCNSQRIMANGEQFSDTKYTIAMRPSDVRSYKLLNKRVTVVNTKNNQGLVVTVTDTGGFAKYHRIADLGIAVKNNIKCTDLCNVLIVW